MPLFVLEEDHSEHRMECGLGAVKPAVAGDWSSPQAVLRGEGLTY